jgi:hypothetical protein
MAKSVASPAWTRFADQADAEGLTVRWVVARERIDPHFAHKPEGQGPLAPADLHPGYRRAVLLGSGGGRFWERFSGEDPYPASLRSDPLDEYTEHRVQALLDILRADDPGAVAAYPFTHLHQIVPFLGLTRSLHFLQTAPFGVTLDPVHGPWFAWRAALLTAAPYPESDFPDAAPCAACAAPCETACPAGAVDRQGFRWRDCTEYRLSETPCRETCLAREACPVGAASRYPDAETRYHYRQSLFHIRQAARSPSS